MCYLFILSEDKMCFNINFQIPKQNKLQIIFADGMKTWSEAIWFFSYVSRLSDTRSRTLCWCSQFYITDKLKILEFWAVARKYNNLNPSPSGLRNSDGCFSTLFDVLSAARMWKRLHSWSFLDFGSETDLHFKATTGL